MTTMATDPAQGLFLFRGQPYRVPAVPAPAWFAIRAELAHVERFAEDCNGVEGLLAFRDTLERLVDLIIPLAIPDPPPPPPAWWRGIWARLRHTSPPCHPFHDASIPELAALVQYVGERSGISTVQAPKVHRFPESMKA